MKNNLFPLLPLLFCVILCYSSCEKEGIGGTAEITGRVAHHNLPIRGAQVFIKFGAKDLPGTLASDFDGSTMANDSGTYKFAELKPGNYYLYAVGFDSSINEVVKGGVPAKLSDNVGVLNVNVPVTE